MYEDNIEDNIRTKIQSQMEFVGFKTIKDPSPKKSVGKFCLFCDFEYNWKENDENLNCFEPFQTTAAHRKELDWANEDTRVSFLTDENFDSFMKNHDSVLVMFYVPCKLIF